jgi:SAM-dependent methyltransferase
MVHFLLGASMRDLDSILRCPITSRPLSRGPDGHLHGEDGVIYEVVDGIPCFLSETLRATARENDASQNVRDFYQNDGWKTGEDGMFKDTRSFVDTRPVAQRFSSRCTTRLGKYFKGGGKFILDAGSGPIPHEELLPYSDGYETRICVDLSLPGLKLAREKLGERGAYLQADITNLPLASNSIDAITCNHVIYQIPAEFQEAAFLELYRVLKPGGIAVIVYWWPQTPLVRTLGRAAKLMRMLTGMRGVPPKANGAWPELYHHPHSLEWFKSRPWPFRYKLDIFRTITNSFTLSHVSDDWRGNLFLDGVYAFQQLAPRYCGERGVMPAIIIRKDTASPARDGSPASDALDVPSHTAA